MGPLPPAPAPPDRAPGARERWPWGQNPCLIPHGIKASSCGGPGVTASLRLGPASHGACQYPCRPLAGSARLNLTQSPATRTSRPKARPRAGVPLAAALAAECRSAEGPLLPQFHDLRRRAHIYILNHSFLIVTSSSQSSHSNAT
jgi:hypothetical protein